LTYDYSVSQEVRELPELAEGVRVRHPRFGAGTVTALDGCGVELKAVIDFESVGRKKVVVRYANLSLEES
jgi:DNA helicase-2/ATP-dependent DNA helicase PcrA